MNTQEIKQMDVLERLQVMEAIWDSLLYDEIEIETPNWHKNILAERKKKIDEGKAEFISIKELKANIRV